MKRGILTSVLGCVIVASGAARAGDALQPLAEIAAAAEREALRLTAVKSPGTRAVARPLDARFRFPQCATPLAARASAGYPRGSRLSIAVRCAEPAWQVYVPVEIHARTRVVVAARPLAARSPLAGGDLAIVEHDVAELPAGYLTDPASILGSRLVRPLAQGEPLERRLLQAEAVIERGQRVTLFWQSSGLRVSAPGEAQAAAAADGRVRVRNLASGREIEGFVRGEGLVEVLP